MRTVILFMLFSALLPLIRANFAIYTEAFISTDASDEGYIFVPIVANVTDAPSCDYVERANLYDESDDVSWRIGIRVVGSSYDPEVIEFNNPPPPMGHYTFYKDRGGALVDLDGNIAGICYSDSTVTYACGDAPWSYQNGHSVVFCESSIHV